MSMRGDGATGDATDGLPREGMASRALRKLLPSRIVPAVLKHVLRVDDRLRHLDRRLLRMQEALGRIEARQTAGVDDLQEAEFRVWSQWGEDGILQLLCRRVPIPARSFVEFGVESYDEANTRFLLVNDDWSGLVLDASAEHVARIRASREHWLHDLRAAQVFVTRENVNEVIASHGFRGDIGVLSIDIDGMDYWVWEALDVVTPAIVVVEYNWLLGCEHAVTVPYQPDFDRRRAHHSLLYYGASLPALCALGGRKGYAFVGCGRHGLNAFFVREDLRPAELPTRTAREGYRAGRFCEAHDASGRRVKMPVAEQQRLVWSLPLERVPSANENRQGGGGSAGGAGA